ncbi:hypothetical protein HanRHA438_Chr05g0202781 [Helianthus annuus]|nr:hypothetical protein HanRHA438_Chr05g0202781 [Helianthus annuus]
MWKIYRFFIRPSVVIKPLVGRYATRVVPRHTEGFMGRYITRARSHKAPTHHYLFNNFQFY